MNLIIRLGIILSVLTALLIGGYIAVDLLVFSDTNMLSSDSCDTPCWKGIKPGLSHSSDVLSLVSRDKLIRWWAVEQEIHVVRGSQEVNPEFYSGLSSINWSDWPTNGINHALIKKDVVVLIRISNYSRLTLNNLIQQIGPPDYFIVYYAGIQIVDRFVGYFPSKGLAVVIDNPRVEKLKLSPNFRLSDIYYFAPTDIDGMFAFWPEIATYANPKCTVENWQTWSGYKEVNVLPHELECAHRK